VAVASRGGGAGRRLGAPHGKVPGVTARVTEGHAGSVWLATKAVRKGETGPAEGDGSDSLHQFHSCAQATGEGRDRAVRKPAEAGLTDCHPKDGGGAAAGTCRLGVGAEPGMAAPSAENSGAAGRRASGRRARSMNSSLGALLRSAVPARAAATDNGQRPGTLRSRTPGSARTAWPVGQQLSTLATWTAERAWTTASPVRDSGAGNAAGPASGGSSATAGSRSRINAARQPGNAGESAGPADHSTVRALADAGSTMAGGPAGRSAPSGRLPTGVNPGAWVKAHATIRNPSGRLSLGPRRPARP